MLNTLKLILFSALLFFYSFFSFSQQSKIDSLTARLNQELHDTDRVKTLNKLSWYLINNGDYDKAMEHANNALSLSEKINFKRGQIISYLQMGRIYRIENNYPEALKCFLEGLKISNEIGDKKLMASLYNAVGIIYDYQGNYPEALTSYHIALKLSEETGDKLMLATSYNNLAIIYDYQGNNLKAIETYFSSLKIFIELDCKKQMAATYNNIGVIYRNIGCHPEALKNYLLSLKIIEAIDDTISIASLYNNIGNIYKLQADSASINGCDNESDELYSKAIKKYQEAIKINEHFGNKKGIAVSYNNIADIYKIQASKAFVTSNSEMALLKCYDALRKYLEALAINKEIGFKSGISHSYIMLSEMYIKIKNYHLASDYLTSSLILVLELGYKEQIMEVYHLKTLLDSALGNYKDAYQHYQLYIAYKDSMFNEENTKKIVQAEMNYEFEKKEAATKAEQEKEIAIAALEQKRRELTIWSTAAGILLVLCISLLVFRSLRITRKRKSIIEKQKEEVDKQRKVVEGQKHNIEEKQKKILDSIHYAKHIQNAVLKGDEHIHKCLQKEHFILFKPKDIVSGDFYWLHRHDDKVLIAIADCTGHGVPGGFMTMLGTSFLKEIVEKKGILHPAQILTEMHKLIFESLNQAESASHSEDGMEMALCCIDNKNHSLEFAGAMSSIYLMQNGGLKEIEGDYYSIGGKLLFENMHPKFTNKIIQLEKKSSIYLFTDGFIDQFGGQKAEKFNTSRFEELLVAINSENMEMQQKKLNEALDQWMKPGYMQIDDILVMGIKIQEAPSPPSPKGKE
jgi:serine phosphatase RsbU (regulator of sigma subunit)